MHIRQIFHTEMELQQKFNQRFLERWQQLVCAYRMKNKLKEGMNVLRAASMAFAFFGAVMNGNAEIANDFDNMLRGEGHEVLMLDDKPVRVDDEVMQMLVWDTAALMLDTDASLPERAQWAFDIVGNHVWLAYRIEDMPRESTTTATSKPVCEVKKIDAAVPQFSEEQIAWMISDAVEQGDVEHARTVREMITRNIMARYHADTFNALNDMMRMCQRKNLASLYVNGDLLADNATKIVK